MHRFFLGIGIIVFGTVGGLSFLLSAVIVRSARRCEEEVNSTCPSTAPEEVGYLMLGIALAAFLAATLCWRHITGAENSDSAPGATLCFLHCLGCVKPIIAGGLDTLRPLA